MRCFLILGLIVFALAGCAGDTGPSASSDRIAIAPAPVGAVTATPLPAKAAAHTP